MNTNANAMAQETVEVQQDATPLENVPAVVEQTSAPAISGEVLPPEPATAEIKLPVGATVSYADLGRSRAKEIAGLDEKIAESRGTLREDILKVIAGPVESHGSYISGFTSEMAEREGKGKDVRTLRNVKSQVQRVLNAFKANPITVKAALENKAERWDVILKKLPKRSAAGRPEKTSATPSKSGEPAASEGSEIPSNIETATDCGKMIQGLQDIAARLRDVAKGKKAWFAEYFAVNVLEAMEMSRVDFQKLYGGAGVDKMEEAKVRELFLLDRKIK